MEEPEFRTRQQQSSGKVASQHFLYTYLQYMRHSITLNRNNVLLEGMRAQVEGGRNERSAADGGKKVVKPQDLVRMYENIIQSLHEVPSLAGLEEDEALRQATESKVTFYRAFRSYYIALAFIQAQKWPEAMAVFQKSKNLVATVSTGILYNS